MNMCRGNIAFPTVMEAKICREYVKIWHISSIVYISRYHCFAIVSEYVCVQMSIIVSPFLGLNVRN